MLNRICQFSASGSLGRVQGQLIELRGLCAPARRFWAARGRQASRRALSEPRTAAATRLVCDCQGRLELLYFAYDQDLGMELSRREAEKMLGKGVGR